MHRDLVDRKRWISEARFLHALNYCMLLPGPEAQQLATYIGWLLHRTWGGIVAGTLFVLPSFAILSALTCVYLAWGQVPAIAGALHGIKPAVVAIVVHAASRIGGRVLRHPVHWGIAIAAFVAIFAFAVPFPAIVLAAALVGYAGGRFRPSWFAGRTAHGATARPGTIARGPAVIDDDTPPPAHARFDRRRAASTVAACVVLWAAATGLLAAAGDAGGTLLAMSWFFTKAAFLTFGGAYAVLPYVTQGAVETYGWLTATQMIDGLALGETTPGPLIMVVAFVGFVGAWTHEIFGAGALPAAGVAGAAVATFFTFLPSFLFILAGAPVIESTHGQLRFTAPLAAISAAVVGVIVNLAAYFAGHVFWPAGLGAGVLAGVDGFALALFALATVALTRYGLGVVPVILAAAAAGLARALV